MTIDADIAFKIGHLMKAADDNTKSLERIELAQKVQGDKIQALERNIGDRINLIERGFDAKLSKTEKELSDRLAKFEGNDNFKRETLSFSLSLASLGVAVVSILRAFGLITL